uniref:C3H1-type domain-containing protein n=1 Tax=Alexandrium monilatum TaxID=311494 RepID=A0A7S4SUK1_9DINO
MSPSPLMVFCAKTRLCQFYQRGKCKRGHECTFAHSGDELRAPPDLACTKLCPDVISTGRCDNGGCRFAHVEDEVWRLPRPRQPKTGEWASELKVVDAAIGHVAAHGSLPPTAPIGAGALPAGVAPSQRPLPVAVPVSLPEIVAEGEPEATLDMSALSSCVSSRSTAPGDESIDYLSPLTPDSGSLPWASRASSPVDSKLAGSPSRAGDAASGNDSAAPTIRRRRNKFHKTRMCWLHAEGRCGKGGVCSFAHGQMELQPLPDLAGTKLCPRLLHAGVCDEEGCTFAHSREELSSSPDGKRRLPAAWRMVAGAAAAVACATAEGWEHDPLGALDWSRVCVKHTFLEWQEDKEVGEPRRRARSAPCGLSRDEPQPGECAETGMPTQGWRSRPPPMTPARSFRRAPAARSGEVPILLPPQLQ